MLGALATVIAGASALCTLAGCGEDPPAPEVAAGATSAAPVPTTPTEAQAQLAALAAAAKDRRMVANYTLRTPDRADRAVTVTLAADGTWRVDVPGGAQGGATDVAIASNANGLYQCALPSTTTSAACVRVAAANGPIPASIDPGIPHIFTDWRDVFIDRRAAFSVALAGEPAGVAQGTAGTCFSVESTSASLVAPVEPGIYCYAPDGTPTAARTRFGTLILAAAPAPPPPTVSLPGPVTPGPALPTAAPEPSGTTG